MIARRHLLIYFIAFTLFAGSNSSAVPIIGLIVKFGGNICFFIMLLEMLYTFIRQRLILNLSPISIIYTLYVIIYITVSIYFNSPMVKLMWFSLLKSVIGLVWLDHEAQQDREILTGPIMYALITWCILDSFLTIIYPTGVPFLHGGYVLGWKNNKIMHLFSSNLLLVFKLLKMRDDGINTFNVQLGSFLFFCMCIINAYIIESSTTIMVLIVLFSYLLFSKIINRTILTNGHFTFVFHVVVFILIVFVRELIQEPLDDLMGVIFDKDATFTGRIYIWRSAIPIILKSFIFGYGRYPNQTCPLNGGFYTWNMAHNQILECMLEGGIILTVLWVYMVFHILIINHKTRADISKFAIFSMFSFLFFFHTEAQLTSISFFIFYILYSMAYYSNENCNIT